MKIVNRNIKFILLAVFLLTICFGFKPNINNQVHYLIIKEIYAESTSYNLTQDQAIKQYPWPHTNQLRKYREATAEEIANAEKDKTEFFEFNGKKFVIFGQRLYSYFFAIVDEKGAFTEYEKVGDKPLYVKVSTDANGKSIVDADGNETYVPIKPDETGGRIKFIAHFDNNYLNTDVKEMSQNLTSNDWFNNILGALLGLITDMYVPIIIFVAVVGAIFVTLISIKFAKSETSDDREKYKKQLIGVIIGIILTVFLFLIAQLITGNADGIFDFIYKKR